jgi:hypothetical protein
MIGRGEEAAELAHELANGLNRMMAGPRRMGKTTLCRAALDVLRNEDYYVAEVDLFAVSDLAQMAERLIDAVTANRPVLQRARHAAARGGRKVASAVSLTPVARLRVELGDELSMALEPSWRRREPMAALERALRLAQRVCEVDDKRLIVLIDEFQELAAPHQPFGDPDRVTKMMRSTLQDCDRLTTIFAGSVEHMMRDLFGPEHRAFHRWGGWHELWTIEPEAWRDGLMKRFDAHRIRISPEIAGQLADLGEGHARATMLIAKQAYLAAITAGEGTVKAETVVVALDMALAADAPFHDVIVEDLRQAGRHVLGIAEHIARGEPPYQDRSRPTAAQRAIQVLDRKGLVEKTSPTGRGGWRIIDPLLRRYLVKR